MLLIILAESYSITWAQTPDEALLKTTELVVKIDGTLGGASTVGGGIIFGREKDKLFIATANHVVRRGEEEAQSLQVTFKSNSSESLPGILLKDFNSKLDLAVVRVDGLEKKNIDVCNFSLNRLGKLKELKRGFSVFAVGHPNGVSWFLPSTSDPVAQVVGDFINFESFRVGKGHSGGALLNQEGGLVGMIRADQPPFGQAARLAPIMKTLEKWNYPVSLRELTWTPSVSMFRAAQTDDVSLLKRLYRVDAFCSPFSYSTTKMNKHKSVLHFAAFHGSINVTKWLIRHEPNVDLNQQGYEGNRALHVAVIRNHVPVVLALLEAGANPNVGNSQGRSPLHVAVSLGDRESVKILIARSADVLATDGTGQTSLHVAASSGQLELAKILLKAKADVMARDAKGQTPLHVAASNGHPELVKIFNKAWIGTLVRDGNGQTPLHAAANSGHLELAKILLRTNADVMAEDGNGQTPLHTAASSGHLDLVKILLSAKADVMAQDNVGDTPLHIGVKRNQLDVASTLLRAGADPNRKNKSGLSPRNIATQLTILNGYDSKWTTLLGLIQDSGSP